MDNEYLGMEPEEEIIDEEVYVANEEMAEPEPIPTVENRTYTATTDVRIREDCDPDAKVVGVVLKGGQVDCDEVRVVDGIKWVHAISLGWINHEYVE